MSTAHPDLIALSLRICDRCVVADIEAQAKPRPSAMGGHWWDLRPMVDDREQAQIAIDMNKEAIDYGIRRGLLMVHPVIPMHVRILRRPE